MNKKALNAVLRNALGGQVPDVLVSALGLIIDEGPRSHERVLYECARETSEEVIAQVVKSVLRSDADNAGSFMEKALERFSPDHPETSQAFCQGVTLGLFESVIDNPLSESDFSGNFSEYVFRIVTNYHPLLSKCDSKFQARLENVVKEFVRQNLDSVTADLITRLSRFYDRPRPDPTGMSAVIAEALAYKLFALRGAATRLRLLANQPKLFVFMRRTTKAQSGMIGCLHYSAREALETIKSHYPNVEEVLLYPERLPEVRDLSVGFTIEIVG